MRMIPSLGSGLVLLMLLVSVLLFIVLVVFGFGLGLGGFLAADVRTIQEPTGDATPFCVFSELFFEPIK